MGSAVSSSVMQTLLNHRYCMVYEQFYYESDIICMSLEITELIHVFGLHRQVLLLPIIQNPIGLHFIELLYMFIRFESSKKKIIIENIHKIIK